MTEEMKKTGDESANGDSVNPGSDQTIEQLQKQIENLNKGIASSRQEAKEAIEAAKAANAALNEYKTEREKGNKPDVELSPEDEKKFEAWAKANGVVTQKELEAERNRMAGESQKNIADQAVSEFLKEYPEFDNDDKWAEVQAEFNLYRTPTDLQGYRKLLERVRKSIAGESSKTDDDAKAKAKADLKRQEALKRGGASQGAASEAAGNDADIENLMQKYPNLSREQIQARLAEIRSLYPDKKKKNDK